MRTTRRSRAVCVVKGHDWTPHMPLHGHYFCTRCHRYDDELSLLRDDAVRATVRLWSPIGISFKRGVSLRLGYFSRPFTLYARLGLHLGWDRTSELPGVSASLSIWRLRLYLSVGHGYQDEDGENRSLIHASATFQTYGLRWIGCWFGHDPSEHSIGDHVFVDCRRCDATIEHRKPVVVGG